MSSLRSTADIYGAAYRMVHALGNRIAMEDPEELKRFVQLQKLLDTELDRCVRAQRDQGFTDADIGQALGTTRQAVSKRWPGGGRYIGNAGRYRNPTAA